VVRIRGSGSVLKHNEYVTLAKKERKEGTAKARTKKTRKREYPIGKT